VDIERTNQTGYNFVMHFLFPSRHWYDRVDSAVVLGALPFRWHVPSLVNKTDYNVGAVVTMNESWELAACCGLFTSPPSWPLPLSSTSSNNTNAPNGNTNDITVNTNDETQQPPHLHHHMWLQLPTIDHLAAPTLIDIDAAITFIRRAASRGVSVYVHCKAGRGRSAVIVVRYSRTNDISAHLMCAYVSTLPNSYAI
jgi:atypical dual specificity phosphatase